MWAISSLLNKTSNKIKYLGPVGLKTVIRLDIDYSNDENDQMSGWPMPNS